MDWIGLDPLLHGSDWVSNNGPMSYSVAEMSVACRTARLSLIKIHLENTAVNLADEEWNLLVDKLEGYSGSDIRSVVIGALYQPVRRMQSSCHWKQNAGSVILS